MKTSLHRSLTALSALPLALAAAFLILLHSPFFIPRAAAQTADIVHLSDYITPDNAIDSTLIIGTGLDADIPHRPGDIWDLASPLYGTTTLDLGDIATGTLASIYVSGNHSFSIVGDGLIIDNRVAGWKIGTSGTPIYDGDGFLTGTSASIPAVHVAAAGKLILGQHIDMTTENGQPDSFNGVLDLTGITGSNSFRNGIDLYSGAIRISSENQLGTTLQNINIYGSANPITDYDTGATSYVTGTIIVAAGGSVLLDSAPTTSQITGTDGFTLTTSATGNRLDIPNQGYAHFKVETSATLTFNGNFLGASGGAIHTGTGSRLIMDADPDGWYVFSNNTVTAENFAGTRGGALDVSGAGTYVEITNAIFDNNRTASSTAGTGGAVSVASSATLVINNAIFRNNFSQWHGAVFSYSDGQATLLKVNNFLVQSNTSMTQGGVAWVNTGTAIFTSGTFIDNASNQTGAMAASVLWIGGAGHAVFNDVVFVNNRNTASTGGGAIGLQNATGAASIDLIATTGTSTFAGNTNNNGSAYSIYDNYTANGSNAHNFTFNTSAGATLDMLDPLYIVRGVAATINITKSGAGLWKLAGATVIDSKTLTTGITNFSINTGTLQLYRAGEQVYVPASDTTYTAKAASIEFRATAAGSPGKFILASNASLLVDGGNSINFNGITTGGTLSFARNTSLTTNNASNLIFDLLGGGAQYASSGTAMLSLGGDLPGANWNIIYANSLNPNIRLILDPEATSVTGSYNLISAKQGKLSGSGANTSLSAAALTALTNNTLYICGTNTLNFTDFRDTSGLDSVVFGVTSKDAIDYLYVNFVEASFNNKVLLWGSFENHVDITWRGQTNWLFNATSSGTIPPSPSTYQRGNIANFGVGPAGFDTAFYQVDANFPNGIFLAGLYFSSTTNYLVTGYAINTSSTFVEPGNTMPAAGTGKLILGARAADDGSSLALSSTNPAALYTGTLTLSNTGNNFADGIDIYSGALLANAIALTPKPLTISGSIVSTPPSPLVTINPQGTFIMNQTTPGLTDLRLAGPGAFLKTGTSTLGLSSNNTAFTGNTQVLEGALYLTPNFVNGLPTATPYLPGTITAAPGATFGGAGSAGAVSLSPIAALQVGDPYSLRTASTLTLASLNLDTYSALHYANYQSTLNITGPLAQNGPVSLLFDRLHAGPQTLITAASYPGLNLSLFTVNYSGTILTPNTHYTLTNNAGSIIINVTSLPFDPNNTITWTGATGDDWNSPAKWDTLGFARTFVNADAVSFSNTTPAPVTTTLNTAATVAGIYFGGDASYSFTGAGSITADRAAGFLGSTSSPNATGKLILGKIADPYDYLLNAPFTGLVDFTALTGTNSFKTGIDIYSGTLLVASNAQFGATLSTVNFLTSSTSTLPRATLAIAPGGNLALDSLTHGTGTTFFTSTSPFLADNGTSYPTIADIFPGAIITSTASTYYFTATTGALLATGVTSITGTDNGLPVGDIIINDPADTHIATASLSTSNTTFPTTSRGTANRLIIDTGNAATITLGQSATFSISNNTAPGSGNNSGAIIVRARGNLLIDAADGAQVIFDNNATGAGSVSGGALYITSATATLAASGSALFIFTSNSSSGLGGAINLTNTSALSLNNALFLNNTANGGALSVAVNSSATLTNILFDDNTSLATNGGAININTGTVVLTSATLSNNNTTTNGGAISIQGSAATPGTLTLSSALIASNTATTNGGGLAIIGASSRATLTDVSFLDNRATTGAAIYLAGAGSQLNINVSPGASPTIAGNIAATATTTGRGAGLFINADLANGVTINVAEGGNLNMFDPFFMNMPASQSQSITKIGQGTWNLGGSSTIALGVTSGAPTSSGYVIIKEGTLHLYGAGEARYGDTFVQPGSIIFTPGASARGNGYWATFQLNDGATLSAGGGNLIKARDIYFDPGANIVLNLTKAFVADTGYAVLSLATVNVGTKIGKLTSNNWTQSISLTGFESFVHYPGDDYNLITLPAGEVFTTTQFATIFANLKVPDGFILRLSLDNRSLQLLDATGAIVNKVVNWSGLAGNGLFLAPNWMEPHLNTPTSFRQNDIANLTDPAPVEDPANPGTFLPAPPPTTISIYNNSIRGITTPGLYISGSNSFVITGSQIITSATSSIDGELTGLAGLAAATGKLTLGAIAAPDADSVNNALFTGTLDLTHSSTNNLFSSGIDIFSGVLLASLETIQVDPGAVYRVDAAGTLILNQAASSTLSTPITGGGAFVKTGTGALTLTANSYAFMGSATLQSGTLIIAPGAALGSPAFGGDLTVSSSAQLLTAGYIGGNLSIADHTPLTIGVGRDGDQTASVGQDLILGDGVTLNFARVTNQLIIGGTVSQPSSGSVAINIDSFYSGTFIIGNFIGLNSDTNTPITIAGATQYDDARQRADLIRAGDNNQFYAILGHGDFSRDVWWTGAVSGISSTTGTWAPTRSDWIYPIGQDADGLIYTATAFGAGDRVHFEDRDNTPTNIIIATSGVNLSDMVVSGTTSYTISGGPIFADPISVFHNPADPASIITPDTATGRLYIGIDPITGAPTPYSGTLTLASNDNLFSGGIQLDSGILNIAATTVANMTTDISSTATLLFSNNGHLTAAQVNLADGATLSGLGTLSADELLLQGAANASITGPRDVLTLTGSISPTNSAASSFNTQTPRSDAIPFADFIKTGVGELCFNYPVTGNAITRISEGITRFANVSGTQAGDVVATVILDGGRLALTANSLGSTAADPNINNARDWSHLTIIGAFDPDLSSSGPLANSAITGANDLIHLTGTGTIYSRLIGGVHVAVDPGPNQTITFNNTDNSTLGQNWRGAIRVDSGALLITEMTSLGGPGSANIPKIVLNGGNLILNAPNLNILGDIQLRTPNASSTIDVQQSGTIRAIMVGTTDGRTATLSPYRSSGFIKTGPGTLVVRGTNNAADILIQQGRYVAQTADSVDATAAANIYASGHVTVAKDATFEFSLPASGGLDSANLSQSRANFTGQGTLEITSGILRSYSDNTDIATINVRNATLSLESNRDSVNFGANSDITIDNSELYIGAKDVHLGRLVFKNNSYLGFWTWSLGNNTTGQYGYNAIAQSLKGAGTLGFSINLARGVGSNLTVLTPIEGDFNIAVYDDTESSVPEFYTAAIRLLDAPPSPNASFTLTAGSAEFDIDLFKYATVIEKDDKGVSIRVTGIGTMSNNVAFINAIAGGMPLTYFAELDTFSQRLGELRLAPGDNPRALSAWLRGSAAQFNFNRNLTGSSYGERRYTSQAGLDKRIGTDDQSIFLGGFAGYGSATRDASSAGDATSNSVFGGIYLSYLNKSGLYADFTSKFNQFKNRFHAMSATYDTSGDSSDARFNNNAIGASLEVGYNGEDTRYGWFIEPSLQAAYTSIAGSSYMMSAGSGVRVNQQNTSISRIRGGIRFGRDTNFRTLGTLNIYVKGSFSHQYTRGGIINATTPDGVQSKDYDPALDGESLSLGAGFAWQLSKKTQFYFDWENTHSFFYTKPWSLNLGVRYAW